MAHRPRGSRLLPREVLGNRPGGARVLVTVTELAGERVGELAAAGDLELAIDAAEMGLGGLGGDKQRLGDLPIRQALGGKPSDSQLAGGQRVRSEERRVG